LAVRDGVTVPKHESLVTLITRWVNNSQQPDDIHRGLLCRASVANLRLGSVTNEATAPSLTGCALIFACANDGTAGLAASHPGRRPAWRLHDAQG
jgi:hypothetical protein